MKKIPIDLEREPEEGTGGSNGGGTGNSTPTTDTWCQRNTPLIMFIGAVVIIGVIILFSL